MLRGAERVRVRDNVSLHKDQCRLFRARLRDNNTREGCLFYGENRAVRLGTNYQAEGTTGKLGFILSSVLN